LDLESVLTITIDTVDSITTPDGTDNTASVVNNSEWPFGLRYISLTHSNGTNVCVAPDYTAVDGVCVSGCCLPRRIVSHRGGVVQKMPESPT
jgi:hypothetical protein